MRPNRRVRTDEAVRVANFRAALRSFQHESETVARANGLTPQRYLLLLMIKGAPEGDEETTVSELSERMKLAQSTVTELVMRAEDAGLVARTLSQTDGRVAHLRLTAQGERVLADVFSSLDVERERLRRAMSELEA